MATKIALVTGANRGMGFEVAQSLALRKFRVIMADKDDQTESKASIVSSTCNDNITTEFLDLSSFKSVRCFANKINSSEEKLDLLINNAGVFCMDKRKTEDCLDGVMQTNYLSPFLLTHLLLNQLNRSPRSRIVFVTSSGSFFHKMTVDKLTQPDYFFPHYVSGAIHYYNSKLCNMIASKVLAKKLQSNTTSNCVHPGMTSTDFMIANANSVKKTLTKEILKLTTRRVEDAADGILFVATSRTIDKISGKYFANYQVRNEPKILENEDFCNRIWDESLKLTNYCEKVE